MKQYLQANLTAYNVTAAEFQSKIAARQGDSQRLAQSILEKLRPRTKLLELGPGSGYIAKLLSENNIEVTTIEFSPLMAKSAASTAPLARVITAEFLAYDFSGQQYQAALGVAFLHLFQPADAQKVVKKINRLLEPGGLAFLSTTLHYADTAGYELKTNFKSSSAKRYRRKYTRKSFEKLVASGGLEIISYGTSVDSDSKRTWMELVARKPAA